MNGSGNVVLTGFMGTGKSAVAQELAALLGWPAVETDDLIQRLDGRSIPEIFASGGETRFRQLEVRAVRLLKGIQNSIIVTGGGTPADPANWRRLAQAGPVVCLTAAADVILKRVAAGTKDCSRPLLAGLSELAARARVAELLGERSEAYRRASLTLDSSLATPAQLARTIRDWLAQGQGSRRQGAIGADGLSRFVWPHNAVADQPALGYPVVAAGGALRDWPLHAGLVKQSHGVGLPRRGLLVTDALVGSMWARVVTRAAARDGLELAVTHVPSGEAAKSLKIINRLYQTMLDCSIGRDGLVVALGGGSVGDAAGFAAATYMRGIACVQLPTTLLSQVDSAVGGKTAIDYGEHKNTVGAFHDPIAVVADPETLSTLPQREVRSGLAEVLKYGIIRDPELWRVTVAWGESLRRWAAGSGASPSSSYLNWIVHRCLTHKAAVVAIDPGDQGNRETLNFGHTLGHAIEAAAHGRFRHGEAVAAGMDFAAFLGERLGVTAPGTAAEVRLGLYSCGLWPPARLPEPGSLMHLMRQDKKARAGRCRFVLLARPGAVLAGPVSVETPEVEAVLAEWLANIGSERG